MDAIDALRSRRTVRSYQDRAVTKEIIETIVDCGRLACTARNVQPWGFVVTTQKTNLARIANTTQHGKHIADAAACIAVFCDTTTYYLEDGSAATQNLLNAAWALGLGACWVAGDKKTYAEELRQFLGAPTNMKLVSLVAIGYPASVPAPSKRPLEEVIHWEHF